jgi:hypothetical protein
LRQRGKAHEDHDNGGPVDAYSTRPWTRAPWRSAGNNQRSARNSDEWIKKEVRHELLTLPWYSTFDNLAYSVNNNEVTLYGQVVQPALKSDAENALKRMEGVEKVNHQIEVLPTSPLEDQIRRAEYRAIYSRIYCRVMQWGISSQST